MYIFSHLDNEDNVWVSHCSFIGTFFLEQRFLSSFVVLGAKSNFVLLLCCWIDDH